MVTTDALKYLPQMDLDPFRVVGCAAVPHFRAQRLSNIREI
jgi:hypothetical protein